MGRALPVFPNDPAGAPPRAERSSRGSASSSESLPLPRSGERKDAARNRKKILDAAKKLMRTRGLEGVCMDELAAAAGVGKGTLYRRFTDKFALFRALLDEDERVLQEAARARFGLPKDAPAPQRLMTTWAAFVDFVVDHADVLAAAEVEAKAATLCDSAPWQWRHIELVRQLTACGMPEARAALLADAWLQALGADVIRRALARASVEEVKAVWRGLPAGVVGADAVAGRTAS